MQNKVKKALVCAAVAVSAAAITITAACSGGYYRSDKLDGDISGEVVSNGGFVVEKGDYIYFINGIQSNTATNSFGEVEKGSLQRIAKADLSSGNYENVQTVVPLIMYSGNYDGGIFIYGDYVYYSTPSSERNSSGEVLNSRLEFRRTNLDGTETMTDYYYQSESTDLDYRFVEVNKKVYLMYAVSETLYGETAHTNIHSINLESGENTLLAYNVSSYLFDEDTLTNPYVYYTMDVAYNLGTDNEVDADYNQVYRVSADATEEDARQYDFSYVEDYDAEEDPLYINLGEFVFDGIGALCDKTQFNYGYNAETDGQPGTEDTHTLAGYTYELVSYEDGTLYYTRTTANDDPVLLYAKDADFGESWNPVSGNPVASDNYGNRMLLLNGSSLDGYTFITDAEGVPEGVVYTENSMLMYAVFSGGVMSDDVRLADAADEVTILSVSHETARLGNTEGQTGTGEFTFLYYGVSGEGNSLSVHRIALGGDPADYEEFPADDTTSNYSDTRILDLDVAPSWYMPEIVAGHFFFASENTDMMDYEYIMTFDLRPAGSSAEDVTMSNAEIEEINDLFDSVIGGEDSVISDIDDTEFENLPQALRYAFYSRDKEYIDELVQLWVNDGEDEEYLYSEESVQMYKDFIDAAEGSDFEQFRANSKTVNNVTVYATSRDYYYAVLGKMTDEDREAYIDGLRSTYMQSEPAEGETTWFQGLSTGAKAGFIIGVCAGGLIVIAAAVLIPLFVIRKKRKTLPQYKKARIKVDTTDDKDIDVYSTDSSETDGEEK